VAGYGEGGLLALYTAAVDKRIDAVLVSAYFNTREKVWDEPIYRNVWGLLTEFGDAEIASLIAPRPLVVEYSSLGDSLVKSFQKPVPYDEYTYTGYKGSLKTPELKDVSAEFMRIDKLVQEGFQDRYLITGENDRPLNCGSAVALEKFTLLLGNDAPLPLSDEIPIDQRSNFSPEERQVAQVLEMEGHVQGLVKDSDNERNRFFLHAVMPEFGKKQWSTKRYHPYFSPDRFIEEGKNYRKVFWEEVLGKFEEDLLSPNPRTKKVYDENLWTGYEVVLDVFSNLIAPGVLLLPKDMK